MLNEPAQGVLDRTVRSVPGSPATCSRTGWKGCAARECSHMSPSLPFRRAHVERGLASGVAPRRGAVAILYCAFCASSVGDLCMAVQHVPVPGPPSLSMMAGCSRGISLCSFAACTAIAAAKILDCSLANAMFRARLFGGTLSADCTGAGRRSLQPVYQPPTGLPRTLCWHQSLP